MSERNDMNLTPEERRLQEAIRGLGEVRADDGFSERLRGQFISGNFGEVVPLKKKSNRRLMWGGAISSMAAILAFLLLFSGDPAWTLKSVTGTGSILVNGQSVDATDFAGLENLVEPGARFVVPATAELELRLGKVMVFGIIRDSDVTIPAKP